MDMPFRVGQTECVRRTFSQPDFSRFAALSGDDNPIHVDPGFSARTKFGRTVAHGMFLYSVVSGVVGSRLPGPGAMQLEQDLVFPSPTFADEVVEVRVEVTDVRPEARALELSTAILRPDGNAGLQGRCLVRLPGSTVPSPACGAWLPAHESATVQVGPVLKGFRIGQRAETRRLFTAEDLQEYAALCGDTNPIVTDAAYARRWGLAGPAVPGGLLGGLFSYLLGTELPGRGTNYLKQTLQFPMVAHPGQELTATVEIVRIRPDKQLVNLNTTCTNPAGEIVCRGEALVWISDVLEP